MDCRVKPGNDELKVRRQFPLIAHGECEPSKRSPHGAERNAGPARKAGSWLRSANRTRRSRIALRSIRATKTNLSLVTAGEDPPDHRECEPPSSSSPVKRGRGDRAQHGGGGAPARSAACMRTVGRHHFIRSDTLVERPPPPPSGRSPSPLIAGEDERYVINRRLCRIPRRLAEAAPSIEQPPHRPTGGPPANRGGR